MHKSARIKNDFTANVTIFIYSNDFKSNNYLFANLVEMVLNKKNIMTTILFGGLLLPFVLITDIFPFLRFGMFVEPIKNEVQTEKFILYKIDKTGKKELFNQEEIGINPNTFYYLCRNYYYRNQMELFSDKIFSSTDPSLRKLEIFRVVTHTSTQKNDTLKIGDYLRHE